MEKQNVFKLRGHHLWAIYDIITVLGCKDRKKQEKKIKKSLDELKGYPSETVKQEETILRGLLFNEGSSILVVMGPDQICLAGCIQAVKIGANKFRLPFCEHDQGSDRISLELFGFNPGKEYSRDEVLQAARALYDKFGSLSWPTIVESVWRSKREEALQKKAT